MEIGDEESRKKFRSLGSEGKPNATPKKESHEDDEGEDYNESSEKSNLEKKPSSI